MRKIYTVFIASPGDVRRERDIAQRVIEKTSKLLYSCFGISLLTVRWEDFCPQSSQNPDESVQDAILERIEQDSIFIGILHKRYGTPVSENNPKSGVDVEYDYAIKNRQRIAILSYYKKYDKKKILGEDAKEQVLKLEKLKQKIESKHLFHQEFNSSGDFEKRLPYDLMKSIISIIQEHDTMKRKGLLKFFKFGLDSSKQRQDPSFLVVYPPMHEFFTSVRSPIFDWQKRLAPNIVYEDFKAIQKIEAALRFIRINDIKSVTTFYPGLRLDYGNRIWICLPRNIKAQEELATLGDRTRFKIKTYEGDSDGLKKHIEWKNTKNETIKIFSPLSKYLELQRDGRRKKWDESFGMIYAKDFAVIARFKMNKPGDSKDQSYFHYFIGGLRGLGTWGAGWFIDRFPISLGKYDNDGQDIQRILQVTYRNFRIIEVKDVSDKDQSHFDRENDMKYICETITQNHHEIVK